MSVLTLEKFLNHFRYIEINGEKYDINNITKDFMVKNLIVTYKKNPTLKDIFEFKSVIKSDTDMRYLRKNEIIDYYYDVLILNRFKYLESFYYSYFYFEDPYTMKWDNVNIWKRKGKNIIVEKNNEISEFSNSDEFIDAHEKYLNDNDDELLLSKFNKLLNDKVNLNAISMQMNDNSRRIVRNLNYLDLLDTTIVTNTCKSNKSFWESLTDVYNKFILADRFFAPSSIDQCLKKKNNDETNYNLFFYLFQQYQPKASILNPFTINWFLKNFLKGKKFFTPVLSWCSYMCAFLHSEYDEYVGVDVIKDVCIRTEFLFNYYKEKYSSKYPYLLKKKIDIYCQPSETLYKNNKFMKNYSNYFDTIMLCPPYFDMEIYQDGDQSTKLYPSYKEWLEKYWEQTIILCKSTLNKEGKLSFIVNDYYSLSGIYYPLINDLNLIVLKYFRFDNCYELINRGSPLRMNHKERTEMLFIYSHL